MTEILAGSRCPGCGVVCASLDVEHLDGCRYQGRGALRLVLPPKFHRIAPGDYETADGVFRLRQLDGGRTQAWNVEWTDEFEEWLLWESDSALARAGYIDIPGYPVDGARTKADALALFAAWWADHGHPAPDWKRP